MVNRYRDYFWIYIYDIEGGEGKERRVEGWVV